jgi:hypothetical protein
MAVATGATEQQLQSAWERNQADHNARNYPTDFEYLDAAAYLVPPDHRIIRLSTLVKLRNNLTAWFEYDDQTCLDEVDRLIAGERE